MFETDRLSPDHVRRCNAMDEIWVPTESVRQVFATSGVAADRCIILASCAFWHPALVINSDDVLLRCKRL